MLCENCGKNEATTHIKHIENGEARQLDLCSECAANLGYENIFGSFGFDLSKLFTDFFGDNTARLPDKTLRCERCGSSFNDIVKTGKVGCAECYRTFYNKLLPSIRQIHGKVSHSGKKPENLKEIKKPTKQDIIERLSQELQDAVKTQNFEQAAVLRDRINQLKEGD